MNNQTLQKNAQFLQRYFPLLYQEIENGKFEACVGAFEVLAGKRDLPTIQLDHAGSKRYLHSQYDPVNEAVRWAEANPPECRGVALFLGWGMGYHVVEWVKQHGKMVDLVIVVEPDPRFFLQSLSHTELSPLTNCPRLEIILGTDRQKVYAAHLKFMEFLLVGELSVFPLPFANIYPARFLNGLQQEIRNVLTTRAQMLKHIEEKGPVSQANAIQNMVPMAQSLFPSDVAGKFKDVPAIVVAAGPSLDKNIDQLHAACGNALIIAVDTSFRLLLRRGIVPEFAVTKDPTRLNLKHFENINSFPETILAFDALVYPDIPHLYKGQRLFLPSRNHAVHKHLKGFELKEDDILPLSSNVALAAFNLAVRMGCSPIVFMGLDLCFSDKSGRSHASQTALLSEALVSSDGKAIHYQRGELRDIVQAFEVEGIDGKKYPTIPTFYEALRLLENLIQAAGVECIDASEGGAKIKGTDVMPFADVVQRFGWTPVESGFLSGIQPSRRDAGQLIQSLSLIVERMNKLMDPVVNALNAVREGKADYIKTCEKAREEIGRDGFLYQALDSALERLIFEVNRSYFWDEDRNPADVIRQRYEWYFHSIKKSCENFIPRYQESIEKLQAI